ncbi:MAG: L-threonylcarbamoyladenylate synthase [Treponemataceae bacterium]
MLIFKTDKDSEQIVVEKLRNREVVIIPSDTIYGFSGLAPWTEDSIKNIKGRDEKKPFIQLIAEPVDIFEYTDEKISQELLSYWPGPLTIIVPLKDNETKCIGFRCPDDQWLRNIIKKAGFPIYSTSVNYSGSPALNEIKDIVDEFESQVALIVDGGDKKNSKPSTIISIKDSKITVIRQGSWSIPESLLQNM